MKESIMSEEDLEIYRERIKDYPNIKPCVDCYYWKYLHGKTYQVRRRNFTDRNISDLPACHYSLITEEAKEGRWPCDGQCPKFKNK